MKGATAVVATIPVTDLDAAKRFYGEVLGLTYLWENPASVRYGVGDSQVSVFKRPPVAVDHTAAHFEVEDIDAAVRELEGKGVEFLDYTARKTAVVQEITDRARAARGLPSVPVWEK